MNDNEGTDPEENTDNTVDYYFPGPADQKWMIPNAPAQVYPKNPPPFWYGLTLYGTTSPNRVTLKTNPLGNSVMPQDPAWLWEVKEDDILPPDGNPKDFPELVGYLHYHVGSLLKTVVSSYATVVTKFSQKCNQWAKDGDFPPGTDVVPTDPNYFVDTFLKIVISDVEPGVCKRNVRAWLGDMFNALRALHTLTIPTQTGDMAILWQQFPNQWPPEVVGGRHKIQSAPQQIILNDGGAVLEDVVLTINLVMDTQGYCIPRGYTLDVSGYSVAGVTSGAAENPSGASVSPSLEDPSSSSSSSSSNSSSSSSSACSTGASSYDLDPP